MLVTPYALPLFASVPLFYTIRVKGSSGFCNKVSLWVTWKWAVRLGWKLGGCLSPSIRRGQRLVPLHAIPRRWAGKPWGAGPVGIASLVCPAGHGDEVGGRKALESMKKQGAGASRLQFFDTA